MFAVPRICWRGMILLEQQDFASLIKASYSSTLATDLGGGGGVQELNGLFYSFLRHHWHMYMN